MALTELEVKKAKVTDKPYKLADGGGMYLLIQTSGSKLWRVDYRFADKRKTLALGIYPDISLADARNRREDARKLLASGIDPGEAKKALALICPDFQLSIKAYALTIKTKRTRLTLTAEQTVALRSFLLATSNEVTHE